MSDPPPSSDVAPPNPFCSNPLRTRADVAAACVSLLDPVAARLSPGRARARLGATATHFDETAAQLEGFARPLWGLGALLAGGGAYDKAHLFREGLAAGTDPSHPEYWGAVQDVDQRMVEACPIGFALAVAPAHFWDPLGEQERRNVEAWLGGLNERTMMNTNWLWFRVFANLGLARNGAAYSQAKVDADVAQLDTFYRGGGWSNDGPDGYTQMDYYSGSFAIQSLQLLYAHLCPGSPRAAEFRSRARLFALDLAHMFDPEGRAVTFGRSLTYRFGMAAFWAFCALADVELPPPLSWGVVRGLLLRNLRWWARQPDAFAADGTLTIGYAYPNANLAENYNSPQSPYWCMLAFSCLAAPAAQPFWTSPEEPYPAPPLLPAVKPLPHPLQIASRLGGHTLLLSSGQTCHYPIRAAESKYGRLVYSSAFAYSVPTGSHTLQQCAPDSALALSDDGGETWRTRRRVADARVELRGRDAALASTTHPWPDVRVDTYLVAPAPGAAENWHLRVHRVATGRDLSVVDVGFAVCGQRARDGRALGAYDAGAGEGHGCRGGSDSDSGWVTEVAAEAFVVSLKSGAVGVADLVWPPGGVRTGTILAADANSNLVEARSALPYLEGRMRAGKTSWFAVGVFALPAAVEGWRETWEKKWRARPTVPAWLREKMEERR